MIYHSQKRYSSNTTPGRSARPQDGDEQGVLTRLKDTAELPRDLPEDIKTLSETHLTGAVILAFVADDWNALPYQLPSEFKYSVLGFYHVTAVEVSLSVKDNWRLNLTLANTCRTSTFSRA